ncbi:zinc finger RNA-binding protein 2 isoform X5 [Tachysurus fulvidraco]|uniref:zinc finger RNA-binding protein 2 isoform X5 n=1 Tax=Tachysurus fulvidraco TaxID=1234273 RepID=UPI001FEF9DAA|nr:zinc finger RNA-binding protein 2 isoform X5 [Tachysurus fulvidraco]
MAASNYYGYAHGAAAPQYSIQPPPTYSHQTSGGYSVRPTYAVDHQASFCPVTAHNPQPAATQTFQPYQTHATSNYTFGRREVEPQQSSTSQTYQVFGEGGNCSYGQPALVSSYDNKQYYQASDIATHHSPLEAFFQTGVIPSGVKSDYRPISAVYSQSPPQGPATVLKTLPPANSVSTSYSVYPASTSIQQPPSSIPTFTLSSSYNSTAATSYVGHNYSSYEPHSYSPTPSYYQATQHLGPQCHSQPQGPSHHPQCPSQLPQGFSHQPQLPQQQSQTPTKQLTSLSWSNSRHSSRVTGSARSAYRKPTFHQNKVQKPKGPPKQPQLHYCDICKISCAGLQTYREHLEGQKHKKKEALQKGSSQVINGIHNVQTQLHCELCDVSCTGADAYKAHIRGTKHLKVVKLHTKLGKPIPSSDPVFVSSAPVLMTTISAKPTKASASSAVSQKPPIIKPPKTETLKSHAPAKAIVNEAKAAALDPVRVDEPKSDQQSENEGSLGCAHGNVQPVGYDYVEEIYNDEKLVRFHCKLCECSFNDPNAKDMHLKGRRHRLQYKKKVNPDLLVDIKPSNRARKLLEEKLRKQNQKSMLKRLEGDQHWHMDMRFIYFNLAQRAFISFVRLMLNSRSVNRRYEEDIYWRKVEEEHLYWEKQRHRLAPLLFTNHPRMPLLPLLPVRRPDSPDDHHIMAKHASIYPADHELEAVQRIVSHSERALKLVSDMLLEHDGKEAVDLKLDSQGQVLNGVMRVGILAKGLLLHGDRSIQLILLSTKKPTISLLNSIAQLLPKQLRTFSEDQYVVQAQPEEANIIIISSKEPKMQVTICLTSPMMSKEPEPEPGTEGKAGDKLPEKVPEDTADALNRTKCLEYLSVLRHTKWFQQARANGLQSCVIIIRVLRDLCQRMPTWGKMPEWAMELLIEKAISSALTPLGPGKALRRVLECISSGILLQDGPGLIDPCEKVQTDALKTMTMQAREDVTASAQHALRLLAFRHINKLLGMDSLTASKTSTYNRKRRSDKVDKAEGEGKKEKKDFQDA